MSLDALLATTGGQLSLLGAVGSVIITAWLVIEDLFAKPTKENKP